jgi:hypothetical protein
MFTDPTGEGGADAGRYVGVLGVAMQQQHLDHRAGARGVAVYARPRRRAS